MFARLWPRVPAAIADDLALVRFARLQTLVPILYVTLIGVVLTAMIAAAVDASWWIRYGVPLTTIGVAAVRVVHWVRSRSRVTTVASAHRGIADLYRVAVPIAAVCGVWAATSWLMSVPGQRSYYPMFMVMGTLTTAFCLASVRGATLAVMVAGLAPVVGVLLWAGNRMDLIAVSVVLLAAAFLTRLILDQHRQQVEMLELRRRLHRQAMTDPLTDLANRRALHMAAEDHLADDRATLGLVLIDLDGFKPVNDCHGHAAGDQLLIEIGARLRAQAGAGATVARIGGDEFAVLLPGIDAIELGERASAFLATLATPFAIDGRAIRIGASAGIARAPLHGTALSDLLKVADEALYAAKPHREAANINEPGNRLEA